MVANFEDEDETEDTEKITMGQEIIRLRNLHRKWVTLVDQRDREIEQLKTQLKLKDFCEVCWTQSWAPVPEQVQGALQLKDSNEYVICQNCRNEQRIKELVTCSPTKAEKFVYPNMISFLDNESFIVCRACKGGHIMAGGFDLIGGEVTNGDWVIELPNKEVRVIKS